MAFGADYNPEQWPSEVWHEDVRAMREPFSEQVVGIACLGHDVEARVDEKARDPLAQQHVVLTDYDSKRLGHGSITVPPGSALG